MLQAHRGHLIAAIALERCDIAKPLIRREVIDDEPQSGHPRTLQPNVVGLLVRQGVVHRPLAERGPAIAGMRTRGLAFALKVADEVGRSVDTVVLGYATEATGPVPKNAPEFYEPDVTLYPFDVEKAKALLDEAGYPAKDGGSRFSLRLLPAPFFSETRAMGDYLKQALAAIGVEAELVSNDAPGHLNAVYKDHNFDLSIGAAVFRGDPAISTTNLVQSGIPDGTFFSNQGGYANPDIDKIIKEALVTIDAEKRVALYDEFQKLVAADLPLINVADWGFTSVVSVDVLNVGNNPRWVVSNWANTEIAA